MKGFFGDVFDFDQDGKLDGLSRPQIVQLLYVRWKLIIIKRSWNFRDSIQ